MATIDKFFRALKEQGGSDLHLQAGQPPKFRIHGRLEPLNMPPLSNVEAERLLLEMLDERKKRRFLSNKDLDFAYEVEGVARFRCNYLRQHHGIGAVFRIIPTKIKSLEEISVPLVLKKLCDLKRGPRPRHGSDRLGQVDDARRDDRLHQRQLRASTSSRSRTRSSSSTRTRSRVITQREVGNDTESFAAA